MVQLIVCRGLPASGKTTYARGWVAEDPTTRARVNKDDLRRLVHDGVYLGRDTENTINALRDNMIRSLLKKGISVVNDDTNLPQQVARDLARIGRDQGAEIHVMDLTDVTPEICIARDAAREHSVGEKVIMGMAKKLGGKPFPLPFPEDPPSEPEVVSTVWNRYVPNEELPFAWIVDIDGTLALNLSGRSPYEWHRVGEDFLNSPVYVVARGLLAMGVEVVLASGRDSVCRPETKEWIKNNAHALREAPLFMRAEGDNRKDSIVKRELLLEIGRLYRVIGVLDDRDQVVEMWREVGLPCFQVAPGDF